MCCHASNVIRRRGKRVKTCAINRAPKRFSNLWTSGSGPESVLYVSRTRRAVFVTPARQYPVRPGKIDAREPYKSRRAVVVWDKKVDGGRVYSHCYSRNHVTVIMSFRSADDRGPVEEGGR